MLIKNRINSLIGKTGFKIARQPSLARDISLGKYRWLQERNISTILDIGANIGQSAEIMRQILPEAMIYSFEPLLSCFQILKDKASLLKPMQCFQFALGKDDAVKTIHYNNFSPSSSILPMAQRHRTVFPYTQNFREEEITVCALDSMSKSLVLKPAILMKVDVQGYELNVLAGAEKTLTLVDTLIIETSFVELYIGQSNFNEVYQFLRDHHFTYMGSFDQMIDPLNGAVLQADSIFVKA
jgi:FkbM family methyltransferase